jgi:hypothetical protein
MKLMVVALLALFPGIFKIGEWILSWTWTENGDAIQVILYVVYCLCTLRRFRLIIVSALWAYSPSS